MRAFQQLEFKVNGQEKYDLIKGDFAPEDGSEIINHLINTKINFLNLRNFSQHIRFNREDEVALKKIGELKLCQQSIKNLVKEAKLQGKSLRVRSNITIELI